MEHPEKDPPVNKYEKFRPPKDWNVNAPEFVPTNFKPSAPNGELFAQQGDKLLPVQVQSTSKRSPSYAEVVGKSSASNSASSVKTKSSGSSAQYPTSQKLKETELCPYAIVGECRFGDQCLLIHGNRCDYCMKWCIHPYNTAQREAHNKECIQHFEKDMELSFAVAQSKEKTCGICMEVVMDKTPVGEQRFGILPSCNHCFCLSCIRRWRQASQFENKIIRACPECRVTSNFVCPSQFWVETKQEKDKLLKNYQDALSNKACRYYRQGSGNCPFGNKCFYLHALPNGSRVDVGPPRPRPVRETGSGVVFGDSDVTIWEFMEDWELQWMVIDSLLDVIDFVPEFEFEDLEAEEFSDALVAEIRANRGRDRHREREDTSSPDERGEDNNGTDWWEEDKEKCDGNQAKKDLPGNLDSLD